MADPEHPHHISTEPARGGETPHVTRYVLGFGLALVILALVLVWLLS